jgi:outer membrane protein TolC
VENGDLRHAGAVPDLLREAEAAAVQAELVALRDEFRDARANLARLVKHPLDTALPALIGPLGSMVLKSLKKRHEPS